MTRDQVKEQFPDATDEQITAILNINGTDVNSAKKNNVDPKELKRLQDIETEYKKLEEAELTDAEKVKLALQNAEITKTNFEKQLSRLEVEKILVSGGLTEEDYKDFIDGMVSTDMESSKKFAESFTNVIKTQKDAATAKLKEELMDKTKGSGGGAGDEEDKTDAEKFAESIAKSTSETTKSSDSIIGNYK